MKTDEKTHCAVCGLAFKPSGCTTGYGIRCDGRRSCFACCSDEMKREITNADPGEAIGGLYLKDTGRPYTGQLTDWPGTPVGNVDLDFTESGFGRKRIYFRGRVYGRWLYGNGPGFGMYTRVKLSTRAPR